jgi:hypothetical protein
MRTTESRLPDEKWERLMQRLLQPLEGENPRIYCGISQGIAQPKFVKKELALAASCMCGQRSCRGGCYEY